MDGYGQFSVPEYKNGLQNEHKKDVTACVHSIRAAETHIHTHWHTDWHGPGTPGPVINVSLIDHRGSCGGLTDQAGAGARGWSEVAGGVELGRSRRTINCGQSVVDIRHGESLLHIFLVISYFTITYSRSSAKCLLKTISSHLYST